MITIYTGYTKEELEKLGFFKITTHQHSLLTHLIHIRDNFNEYWGLNDRRGGLDDVNDFMLKSNDNLLHAMKFTVEQILSRKKFSRLNPSIAEIGIFCSKFQYAMATDEGYYIRHPGLIL